MTAGEPGIHLRTLGHPVLVSPAGVAAAGLRRKDLALLAYLCVERLRPHSRARLAALLWGESPEARARHSLTQALGRIVRAAGRGALVVERESVRSTGAVECDAEWLLAGDERLDSLLSLYDGPFLEGFEAGFGSEEFGEWAEGRRAELRNAAVRWLEAAGAAAEAEGDWALALRVGERGTQIDPVWEQAHRRVLRALFETGERNQALRHAAEFARWLEDEVGGVPDPETLALVARIRDAQPEPSAAPPPAIRPPAMPLIETVDEDTEGVAAASEPEPTETASADPPASDVLDQVDSEPDTEEPDIEEPIAPEPRLANPSAAEPESVSAHGDSVDSISLLESATSGGPADSALHAAWMPTTGWGMLRAVILLAAATWAAVEAVSRVAEPPPGHGESIQQESGGAVYLAYAETLWRYPDEATLDRCLAGWRSRVRRVRRLPAWPRRTLASVTTRPWMGGTWPVHTDHPRTPTQYVAVGCVLAPIPNPPTFKAIFGHTDWSRSQEAPDALIRGSPGTSEAGAFPVRRAGTLIRGARGGVKWIVFHGGALSVAPRVLASYCRTIGEAVRVPDAEFRYYHAYAPLPPANPSCDAARPPCSATALARHAAIRETADRGRAPEG